MHWAEKECVRWAEMDLNPVHTPSASTSSPLQHFSVSQTFFPTTRVLTLLKTTPPDITVASPSSLQDMVQNGNMKKTNNTYSAGINFYIVFIIIKKLHSDPTLPLPIWIEDESSMIS